MSSQKWILDCIDHWSALVCESDIGVDWSDAFDRCWRCGEQRRIQKCHIVAKQFGGGDDRTNIVPLCSECHDESPDVTDEKEMWRWIKETRPMFYGTLKLGRALKTCIDRGVDVSRFSPSRFNKLMEDNVGLHLMQNGTGCRIKSSSIAWALEKACETEVANGTRP